MSDPVKQPERSRLSIMTSLLCLWRLAPRKMRRLILKGLVFRMLQAFCLAGVFGMVSLWGHAFASGLPTSSGPIGATCFVVLLLLLLQFLFAYWSVGCIWLTSFRLVGAIRQRLLRRLLDLPMTFHLSHPKGDLANALTSDLLLIENLLTDGLPRLVHSISLPLFVLIIIAGVIDPLSAAIATLPILAALPLLFLSCRRLAGLSDEKQNAQAHAASQILQWVEGMTTVRSFGMRETRRNGYSAPLLKIHRISVQMVVSLTAPLLGFAAIVIGGLALVVAFAGYRHGIGTLSTGQTAAILILSLPLYVPLLGLAQFMELATVAKGAFDRLAAIVTVKLIHLPAMPTPSRYSVTCEKAGYHYSSATRALKPTSVHIGETGLTAIVGPSGAGKSTLLQLFAGLLQPTEGRVLIGGVDVVDIRPDDLNKLVSFVFQDVVLLSGSVRDNIAMGNPDATQAEIEMAAEAAGAHAFISELPDGYDTQIGEAGFVLSSGERQRLSLARGILKNTPIMLIDEGTASVDNLTVQQIASALKVIASDRSIIVATHDLSSLEGVEQIIMLDRC